MQCSPAAVARAWEMCRDSGEAHPPSLPVFLARVKAAAPMVQRDDARIVAMHEAAAAQAAKQLPPPDGELMARLKAAPNTAKAALEAMRSRVRGARGRAH